MNNKVRLIDINIFSSYMGRFLTAIVAAAVFAITVSALLSDGADRTHVPLVLGIAAEGTGNTASGFHEPLKKILADGSGRAVEIRPLAGAAAEGCDLYILPLSRFLGPGGNNPLVPVYSICSVSSGLDHAVLVSRPGWDASGVPVLKAGDVVFAESSSSVGLWHQLEALEAGGFVPPDDLSDLCFAPAQKVVFEVLMGRYVLGACRQSDVQALIDSGAVGEDEITVVRSIPAFPEKVFACRGDDTDYFNRLLRNISTRLASAGTSPAEDDTALLLKARGVRGLRPVTAEQLAAAGKLSSRYRGRNTASNR